MGGDLAGVQEVTGGGGQAGVTLGIRLPQRGGLLGGGEAGALVQVRRVAVVAVPFGGVLAQRLVDQQGRAIGVDPEAKLWPGADQGLMGELDGVRVHRQQAGFDEPVEHLTGLAVLGGFPPGQQLVQRHDPAGVVPAVAESDQAGEHLAGDGTCAQVQLFERGIGGAGQRPMDSAGRAVTGHGQHPPFAVLPGDQQGVRQQRQHPHLGDAPVGTVGLDGLGAQVLQDEVDQPGLQTQPGLAGRSFDGLAELGGGHRPDHHRMFQHGHQLPVSGAVSEEVGAHAEDDDRGGPRPRGDRCAVGACGRRCGRVATIARWSTAQHMQGLDEDLPLPLVAADGEQLLELVDDDDRLPPVQCVGDHLPQYGRVLLQAGAQVRGVGALEVGQAGGQCTERVGAGGQQDDLGAR